jgi:hypothetical protein
LVSNPRYIPFMKLKANEVGAFAMLTDAVKGRITPFFDIARKEGLTAAAFVLSLKKSAKKLRRYLGDGYPFYIDNFDLPDSLTVAAQPSYASVVTELSATSFIPVVGLDRSPAHNAAIFAAKASGEIRSSRVAIRLVEEAFSSFDLVESELADVVEDGEQAGFNEFDLVLDSRVCRNVSPSSHAGLLHGFIIQATAALDIARVIVTGSSIPASIAEVAKVLQQEEIDRIELQIVRELREHAGMADVVLGDYTIVSPMYSEVNMPPEMLLNITAPKVLYSHGYVHYISRGGALRTHARGNLQYNDIAADLVAMSFYRGPDYSFGDEFLSERAGGGGNMVTPGSILKPTINAHITYMATDHPLAV